MHLTVPSLPRIAGLVGLAAGWVLGLVAAPAIAVDLEGRLLLESRRSKDADPRSAVISFEPAANARAPEPSADFAVSTVRKDFSPRVLVVPVGSTVRFPNEDPILHNVFSVSGANRFDLGLYGRGESSETTFEHPGVVKVYCNVHPDMVANVVVLDTAHVARPDREGRFVLRDLPSGEGTLTIWHERAESLVRTVRLPLDGPLEVALELNRPRVPKHFNKFGKPYSKRRGRRY